MTARRKYSEAMGRYMDAFCMDPGQPLSALVLGTHTIFLRLLSVRPPPLIFYSPCYHSFLIYLFISLFIYLLICLLFVYLFIYLFFYLFFYLFIHLFINFFIYLFVYFFIYIICLLSSYSLLLFFLLSFSLLDILPFYHCSTKPWRQ
jgi:hypothetical protein